MKLCFDCVLAQPHWLERYMAGWYFLVIYAGFAFAAAENNISFVAQAIWFGLAFPFALWPVVASVRASNHHMTRTRIGSTSIFVSATELDGLAMKTAGKHKDKLATHKNSPRKSLQTSAKYLETTND